METSSAWSWLSELESMDEFDIMHQCHMDSLADLSTAQAVMTFQQPLSSEINSFCPFPEVLTTAASSTEISQANLDSERPSKQLKPSSSRLSLDKSNSNSNSNSNSHSNSNLLQNKQWDEAVSPAGGSMMSIPSMAPAANDPCDNTVYAAKPNAQGIKKASSVNRCPSQAQDHIMAERRRREKLSERFVALSALVPGLKKMDKASVLGDAIKYLKQLQEQVKVLEEQSKKRTVESVVFVKKSQLSPDDESSSCEEATLPEIEAKVSGNQVLIRIHCENQKGVIMKILAEIEKLHLCVVNSSVLPFGNLTLDMTIIAQNEANLDRTNTKDLVKELRLSLLKFM